MTSKVSRTALAFTALLLAACSSSTDSTSATAPSALARRDASANGEAHGMAHGASLSAEQLQAVAAVRNATARFHDIDIARAAGYTQQYPAGCRANPAGAQGFHYLNPALVDDKTDLLQPELIMYEPQKNGSLKFIGVDYIIPFDKWTSPEPPTILGVPMMRNEGLQVWALHIWAWRPNPSGMFAMWNPRVSCEYAG